MYQSQSCAPTDTAAQAAEALRRLCHQTQSADAFEDASDVYSAIGNLEWATTCLRQALEQISRALQVKAAHGTVYDDRRTDPAVTVQRVSESMDAAARATASLTAQLAEASRQSSHLGGGRRAPLPPGE